MGRWQQQQTALGCAIAPIAPTYDGQFQNFERGQIVWSPGQGNDMIISGYRGKYWDDQGEHFLMSFYWNTSHPFDYEKWLIRLDRDDNANLGQWECVVGPFNPCSPTSGGAVYGKDLSLPGHSYQFRVEGCDYSWPGGHDCPRSWTIPVWIWY